MPGLMADYIMGAGDDFTVDCVTNPNMSFKLDSSTLSMSGSRKLKDHHNHVLCNMKHKVGGWDSQAPSLPGLSSSGSCKLTGHHTHQGS